MKIHIAPMEPRAATVAVAMLGARLHYAVPRALYEAGMLDQFFTDSYIGNKPWLEAMLRLPPHFLVPRGLQRWLGRKDALLPPAKVKSSEILGLWYAWARSRARTSGKQRAVYEAAARKFSTRVIDGLGDAGIVWGFNDASLDIFAAAKRQGRRCILEQTILPPQLEQQLIQQESIRWPGWQPSLQGAALSSAGLARAKDEWAMADLIVAGSEFVRLGLQQCGVPSSKIRVVPYGVEDGRFCSHRAPAFRGQRPLHLLFVGEVGLRKGVPDLLVALASLRKGLVQARFAGELKIEAGKLEQFRPFAEFLGPVPRMRMPELYAWADVFVLPSIVEGSATVTYESLMAGVPVITTPNAGSIVRDDVDGRIIPMRDAPALAAALSGYLEDSGRRLAQHADAVAQSRSRASLDRYAQDLVAVVRSLTKDAR